MAIIIKRYGFKKPGASLWLMLGSIFIASAFGFYSTGRGVLISFLIAAVTIFWILRVRSAKFVTVLFIIVFLAIFFIGGVLLYKGGSPEQTFFENIASMGRSFITYLVGPSVAFSYFLDSPYSLELGVNVFRFVFAVLRTVGLHDVYVAPLVQEAVDVPMAVNVYTVYYQYTRDFGVPIAILFQFLFGFFHGFLYRKATTENPHPMFIFLFAIFMFPLATQHFVDTYFSLLSLWLKYLIFSVIIFVILPKKYRLADRRE
jgi:oligosaccharide repeat unit polymerase